MTEPKQILKCVTVTGADDTIEPGDLSTIAERYPYVEFGILLSNRYSVPGGGCNRFPSRDWLRELRSYQTSALRLSGHICGAWVHDIYEGEWPDALTIVVMDLPFRRFQLNTHGEKHDINNADLLSVVKTLGVFIQEAIFQLDNNSGNEGAELMLKHDQRNVSGLFDLSHGAGVLPSAWPKPIQGLNCGYAGGLSVANVREQLFRIQEVTDGPTWIDAETHLRGTFRDNFSLDKVCDFLEAAKPWVISC